MMPTSHKPSKPRILVLSHPPSGKPLLLKAELSSKASQLNWMLTPSLRRKLDPGSQLRAHQTTPTLTVSWLIPLPWPLPLLYFLNAVTKTPLEMFNNIFLPGHRLLALQPCQSLAFLIFLLIPLIFLIFFCFSPSLWPELQVQRVLRKSSSCAPPFLPWRPLLSPQPCLLAPPAKSLSPGKQFHPHLTKNSFPNELEKEQSEFFKKCALNSFKFSGRY